MTRLLIFLLISNLFFLSSTFGEYDTPRWVSNRDIINLRSSFLTDEDGNPIGTIKYQYLKKNFPFEVTRNINDQWVEAVDPLSGESGFLFRPILSAVRGGITKENLLGYDSPKNKKVLAKIQKNTHGIILSADAGFVLFEVELGENTNKKGRYYIPKDKILGIYSHEQF
tara:strand:- start:69 stop:575 length:507 start_codon:yes stop_codon:yes gene_type:complete